jgi:hypothetical protein
MGPPLRSFAADAHGCIMVRVLGPTGYKVVARLIRARKAGSPLIVISTASSGAIVLGAVKVRPNKGGECRKVGATANLDSSCARRPERSAGRTKKRALGRTKKLMKEEMLRNSLTKKSPIQGNISHRVLAWMG